MDDGLDVRALREKLGWTQEKLADYLGLDRTSISRMENGQAPTGPVRRLLDSLAAQSAQPTSEAAAPDLVEGRL